MGAQHRHAEKVASTRPTLFFVMCFFLGSVLASFYNPTPVTHATIQEWHKQSSKRGGKTTLLDWYRKVCSHFNPILHKWLLNRSHPNRSFPFLHFCVLFSFPDPAAWFEGRVAYARTAAVWYVFRIGASALLKMAMRVGPWWDMSLGSGTAMQRMCCWTLPTGSACTWTLPACSTRAKSSACPSEFVFFVTAHGMVNILGIQVPFRLTPNMVDALGVCGHAGLFRETCVLTLSVLRSNHDTLMNVLDSFLHDPLVEWSAGTSSFC